MIKKLFLAFSLCIFIALPVHSKQLEGVWDDKKFSIELDKTFHEIDGYWGKKKYSLDISSAFQDIDGYIGKYKVDLDFSNNFSSISGLLPCGKVKISISRIFQSFDGRFCGKRVELNSFEDISAKQAAEDLVIGKLVESFPKPLRNQIFSFIRRELKLTKEY